jgi:hypothetical protein
LALLTLALSACDGPTPPLGEIPPLVPLAVGNTWAYEVRPFPGTGVADTVVVAITGGFSAQVDGSSRALFAEQSYLAGSQPAPGDPAWFYGNEPDGYYFYGGAVAGDTMLMRSPWFLSGDAGTTWRHPRMVYHPVQAEWRILEDVERVLHRADVPCQTPLGERHCLEVRFYLPPLEEDVATGDWHQVLLAPGLGMVVHDLYADAGLVERKAAARLLAAELAR